MATLYLVRHGECTYNVEGIIQGQLDSPLTSLGCRQAESVATRLASCKIDEVYSTILSGPKTRRMQLPGIITCR